MYNSLYLPACSFSLLYVLENGFFKFNSNQTFRFYNKAENPCYEHNGLLVSAGLYYKKRNLSKDMKMDFENSILLGDSGGYQIATGVIDINGDYLEPIFDWLENNTNYALNIDVPIYINKEGVNISLQDKLKTSYRNFEYFYKNQSGKTKYLNVMHGKNQEDLNLWYNEVSSKFDFDGGWALGSSSGDIFYPLQSLFFLIRKGRIVKRGKKQLIHILGMSRSTDMIIFEYLQRKLNENEYNYQLTFDSSTPGMESGMGKYLLFLSFDKKVYLPISHKNKNINMDALLPCQCPVCKDVRYKDLYQGDEKDFNSISYGHIAFHNLYSLLEYKKKIDRLLDTNNKDLYKELFNEKIMFIFDTIDNLFLDMDYYDTFLQNKYKIMSEAKIKYDISLNEDKLF